MPNIPLASWADTQLQAIAELAGVPAFEQSGNDLLAMRMQLHGWAMPGRVSAGGGCRLYDAADGIVALNLSRPDDVAMLPALFCTEAITDVEQAFKHVKASKVVAQGRALGMAIAHVDEKSECAALATLQLGTASSAPSRLPIVLDLSSLWAGPLAGYLLAQTGAKVIKVESANRPDGFRDGDPALYAKLNGEKEIRSIDLRSSAGRLQLLDWIAQADIVIEAARPRALLQLGIDADALVQQHPRLVWVTITAHGADGDAANWIGFGDDCGVAAGLSAALRDATGEVGFVGDAIADPLTGIFAAQSALEQLQSGIGARLVLSMSGVVAKAMAETPDLEEELKSWSRQC